MFEDFLDIMFMEDYEVKKDSVEVKYELGKANPVLEFPIEDLEEIKEAFRKQIIDETEKIDRVKFILFLNSFTYVMTACLIMSLISTGFGVNSVNVFMSSYVLGMLAQLACYFLGETFPVFNPKRIINKKKLLEKYKLFLENEKEILEYLKREEDSNNRVTAFTGDLREVKNTPYEEILYLTKQVKKHSI